MKSYSDTIPNVSTEELQRSAKVGDETHRLVKNNLTAIESLKSRLNMLTLLLVLTLVTSGASLYFAIAPLSNG